LKNPLRSATRPRDLEQITTVIGGYQTISFGNQTICKQIVCGHSMSVPTVLNDKYTKIIPFCYFQGRIALFCNTPFLLFSFLEIPQSA